ncbi:DUF6082 family protein [Streptomyces canus]|uniref:DUF6082 family protein n=1 Tax=Streptomyces canus TaxID=58343 RepID=UPI0027D7A30E|nr:DUF6082 family protein [Streptomyces canus]
MDAENPDARGNDSAASGRSEEWAERLVHQLALLAKEIRYANLIQLHRISVEQMEHGMADPALADAVSTLSGLTERERRQMIHVNARYHGIVLQYRVEAMGWNELMGHLRVLCRNPIFDRYWELTRDHRRSLPRGSLEARVGKAVDVVVQGLREEPEVWWVVAHPDEPSP